jgi:hypothetical protein
MTAKIFAITVAPLLGAAGVAATLAMAAPAAAQIDPCSSAVSTSRCLGPQGVDGGTAPKPLSPGIGSQNGPYGPWGSLPPLG